MSDHLVTVICLCYNQERFVVEALRSVSNQTHTPIQLIVVDDKSSDQSAAVIERYLSDKPGTTFIRHSHNKGSCASFNEAMLLAKGDFIIDLAADDVLLPDRVRIGIAALEEVGEQYGVHFSDADLISEEGDFLYKHSDRFPHATIPQGDIYKDVIKKYFICSPTVMYRKSTVAALGGYDENLSFEDFDFWIRSSRKFNYIYSPRVLMKKRLVTNSMSQNQFRRSGSQRWSTLEVCKKIKALNRSKEEDDALKIRLSYEIRVSLRLLDFTLAYLFYKLRRSI